MVDLPRNLNAEEALVGSSLLQGDITGLALQVEPAFFSSSLCSAIWSAMLYLRDHDDPIDIISVSSTIGTLSSFSSIETSAQIVRLVNQVPSSAHLEKYADLVLTEHARRRLAQSLPNLSKIAYGRIAQSPSEVFSLALAELEIAREGMEKSDRKFWTTAELTSLDMPNDSWLLDRLIVNGGLNLLAGETRSGKTYACLDLALCMAGGGGIAWGKKVGSGATVYFGADNSLNDLARRIKTLSAGRQIQEQSGNLLIDIDPLDLGSMQSFITIENIIKRTSARLIIFDALVRYLGSLDENNARDVAAMMARFRRIANVNGCTFLFIHHLSKLSGRQAWSKLIDRVRGSGDLVGAVDSALIMTISGRNPRIQRHLRHVKCRIATESQPLEFGIIEDRTNCVRLVFENSEMKTKTETIIEKCLDIWVTELKASQGERFSIAELSSILEERGINPSESTLNNARSALRRLDGILVTKKGRTKTYSYNSNDAPINM